MPRAAFVCGAIAGALLAAGLFAAEPPPAGLDVVLLGTGYPRPHAERAGPATAIVVNKKVFLVDAGRGVVLRMAGAQLPLDSIRAVFLTHLHSDHTAGLPDLFNTSWMFGRHAPLELYGPPGTKKLADATLKFFADDIRIRRDIQSLPAAGATFKVRTVREGVVYQDDDVRVTAFRVEHPPLAHAFGYRFDAKGKSVVISGDTRRSENLIRHARGADILVHEAYLPEWFDKVDTPEVAARLKQYHTSAEEAGQVAQAAGVKLLVLTHVIPADADETFLERARQHFTGRIVVGRDLMRF